ncbi:MAG: type II toxin-antitoxin system Phd/YefM family antitoxin [Planctomycetales bacterium]|nr:type II toxin-antitoxin system Phd/YefM family antitoxin [Planctomycetales bacterium]
MKTIGVYQAKARLSSLLARVAKGERFAITRHGTPMAVLGPAEGSGRPDAAVAIAALREARKGLRLRGLTIRELIETGRR